MNKRKKNGTSLVEMLVLIIIGTIMITSVFSGINVIINSLQYSKKVMFKLYTRKDMDMTFEMLDFEIKRTGSLGPVVKGLPGFYNNSLIDEGNEDKGVFALSDNEFVIQYGVTYPFILLKQGNTSNYEKIIKNKSIYDQAT